MPFSYLAILFLSNSVYPAVGLKNLISAASMKVGVLSKFQQVNLQERDL